MTVAIAVAVLLALLVLGDWRPLANLDARVANDLNSYLGDRPHLVDALDAAAVVFHPWVFRLVVLAVAAALWQRGARPLAAWALTTAAVGGVVGVALKLVVMRARPAFDEPVARTGGYSFPSGHALNSFLCTGVLILIFLPVLSQAGRKLAYVLGATIVALTGFDRVALGVHYVSDVVAGWLVALACLAGTAVAFEIWRRGHDRPPSTASEEGDDPDAPDQASEPPQPTGAHPDHPDTPGPMTEPPQPTGTHPDHPDTPGPMTEPPQPTGTHPDHPDAPGPKTDPSQPETKFPGC